MLLNDLIKLFSRNFDISEERFLDIIESNNIKMSQRLLCNINTGNIEKKTVIVTGEHTNSINETESKNNLQKKTETGGRGRGRPRKTKALCDESDVLLEVELLKLNGEMYYKTNENVILNMDMEILGILLNGEILSQSIK